MLCYREENSIGLSLSLSLRTRSRHNPPPSRITSSSPSHEVHANKTHINDEKRKMNPPQGRKNSITRDSKPLHVSFSLLGFLCVRGIRRYTRLPSGCWVVTAAESSQIPICIFETRCAWVVTVFLRDSPPL